MFNKQSIITASALFAGLSAGAAVSKSSSNLVKRGDSILWSQDGGNTEVRFGDGKVYLGSLNPTDLIASLYDNCYDQGFCNSDSWELTGTFGDNTGHTITVTAPEGQYQSWIKNGLVEALTAALSADGVVSSETIYAQSGGGCVGCTWYGQDITTYTMPDTLGISHDNDGTVPDVITLKITNDQNDIDSGLCSAITGIGNALAGSVSGVAGGIFQLGSVACGAIPS